MAFIQPCFIRKNTPELRNKLEELGYKPFGSIKYEWDTGWGLSTDNRLGEFESFDNNGLENIIKCEPPDYEDSIDCGDNEDLFIALAALRDDTSINDFYWFNRRLVKCEDKTEKHTFLNGFIPILKCRCVDDPNICFGVEEDFLKKATVEEIIKHFKKD